MIVTASPLAFVLTATLGLAAPLAAQPPAPTAPPASRRASPARAPYALTVKSEGGFINIGLTAQGAKVGDVAAELGRRLGLRVVVGPAFAQETLTVDVPESVFESALTAIAPHAIVDYEFRAEARPKPLVVYLLGANDEAPKADLAPRGGATQGLLIMGHTEENPANATEDPVKVSFDANGLSVRARRQPLALVAMAVADALGVQLELADAAEQIVDVDVENASVEDGVASLSPHARLLVRVDLSRSERTPLRLAIVRPGGPGN